MTSPGFGRCCAGHLAGSIATVHTDSHNCCSSGMVNQGDQWRISSTCQVSNQLCGTTSGRQTCQLTVFSCSSTRSAARHTHISCDPLTHCLCTPSHPQACLTSSCWHTLSLELLKTFYQLLLGLTPLKLRSKLFISQLCDAIMPAGCYNSRLLVQTL